jgi:hypothetical protein
MLGLGPFVVAQTSAAGSLPSRLLALSESLLIPGFAVAFVLQNFAGPDLIRFIVAIGSVAFWIASAYLVASPRPLWVRGSRNNIR